MTDKERDELIQVLKRILTLIEDDRVKRQMMARRVMDALDNYAKETN